MHPRPQRLRTLKGLQEGPRVEGKANSGYWSKDLLGWVSVLLFDPVLLFFVACFRKKHNQHCVFSLLCFCSPSFPFWCPKNDRRPTPAPRQDGRHLRHVPASRAAEALRGRAQVVQADEQRLALRFVELNKHHMLLCCFVFVVCCFFNVFDV